MGLGSEGLRHFAVLLLSFLALSFLFVTEAAAEQLQLSPAETAFLNQHPLLKIGVDTDYAPYSFQAEDGRYRGVAIDYIERISQLLGVRIAIVPHLSRSETFAGGEQRSIDLIATAAKTDKRKGFLDFSQIYIPTPLVVMTREEDFRIREPADLAQKRVALVAGYAYTERVMTEHPALKPILVATPLEGLQAVTAGGADAYIGTVGVIYHHMQQQGISRLKIASAYDLITSGQRFAVRDDWPLLSGILDKALETIPEEEKRRIMQRWVPQTPPQTLGGQVILTSEERSWLDAHPHIRLGIDPEYAPFAFVDPEGRPKGIALDYVELLNRRLNASMEVVRGLSWAEVTAKMKRGEIDVLPAVGETAERSRNLLFSDPYLNFQRVVITRTDQPFIRGLEDLSDWRIAVQAGTSDAGYLQERTELKLDRHATLQAALRAVSAGEADAFIGDLAPASYWIRKLSLTNLKVAAPVDLGSQELHFAVRQDWPILVRIINKGLATISDGEATNIQQRWVGIDYDPGISIEKLVTYIAQIVSVALLVILLSLFWSYRLKKEVARRRQVEVELKRHNAFEHFIAGISAQFIALDAEEMDAGISRTLEELGQFLGVDASYVFLFTDNAEAFSCTHLWSSGEMPTYLDKLQDLRVEKIPWWMAQIQSGEKILLRNLSELPAAAAQERDLLGAMGIAALVNVPMLFRGRLIGLLGVSSGKPRDSWNPTAIDHLDLVGQILTNALQRRRIERALQQATRQAKLANRTKSTFLASMSHELRTPLNSIIGFLGLVIAELSGPLNFEQQKQLRMANGSAQHLLNLINDILDISKIEAGELQVERRPFDMAELVEHTCESLRPLAEQKGLPLQVEIAPEVAVLNSDRRRVSQVLINLLNNAIKFTESGFVKVTCEVLADKLITSVTDSGIGIPEADLQKVFDPFQQIDTGTDRHYEGTGLGLSICQRILELLNGSIRVESQADKGSRFIFELPIDQQGDG